MKIVKHQREKLMKTSEDGKITHARGLVHQQCENDHMTKSHLHVQHNPYQNSNDILHRNRKVDFEIHMKHKRPPIPKVQH
jgi:hypothetical protein